jgi:hypothetical protein
MATNGPRMLPAADFLGAVKAAAPTPAAFHELDCAYAHSLGKAPRTLERAVRRARERGVVSEKVVTAFAAFAAPVDDRVLFRGKCPRCGCYRRSLFPSPSSWCDPCARWAR